LETGGLCTNRPTSDVDNCAFDSGVSLEFEKNTKLIHTETTGNGTSDASWVLSVVEDMRNQGVIKSFFDQGWIQVQTDESGSITWTTKADKSSTFLYEDVQFMPVWQQILESIFEHGRGENVDSTVFQQWIGTEHSDCKQEAHLCRAQLIQEMLRNIHTGIEVVSKLCTLRESDLEECIEKADNTEASTTCTAFTVDRKRLGNQASRTLAVSELRKQSSIWELDVINPLSHFTGTYICNPAEWTRYSQRPHKCTSKAVPQNYFEEVFRYTISGLPLLADPDVVRASANMNNTRSEPVREEEKSIFDNPYLDDLVSEHQNLRVPFVMDISLELEKKTNQKKDKMSEACWVLSIVEDLRYQGVIQTFFDKGWIEARNNEDGSITWRTTAGKSGTFLYEGVQSIPVWQQIL